MSYKQKQEKKQIEIRDSLFHDPGFGEFRSKDRPFVLKKAELNLHAKIRRQAIDYFDKYEVEWWGGSLTGHLLSSQVSCLNHLFFLRNEKDLALRLLQGLNKDFVDVCEIDDGFIGFEAISKGSYLNEGKTLKRGANCTSIDAMMIGKTITGKKILVLIEWKYTELYSKECKADGSSGKTRKARYNDLICDAKSPINAPKNLDNLYYEPFYQIMRQTLLAWQMVENKDYDADDWMHIEVVPENNIDLRYKVHSPDFEQSSVEDAWKNILKDGDKYQMISPQRMLKPFIFDSKSTALTRSVINYLIKRYW